MGERARAEEVLRAVFHGLADACCLLSSVRDEAGQIVDFEVIDLNAAGERAMRRTRDAVIGKRLAAVFYDAAALESARVVVMTDEPLEEEVEGTLRRMTPAGDGVAVTLRRTDEVDAGPTTEALTRALGGLAHDFNNLLTPILAYTNLGLSQVQPGEPLHEELLEIRRAAERASALVQRVQSDSAQRSSHEAG